MEKNPNYSLPAYDSCDEAWWGSSGTGLGNKCVFWDIKEQIKKIFVDFVNNTSFSNDEIDLIGKTSYKSFRKTKSGPNQKWRY